MNYDRLYDTLTNVSLFAGTRRETILSVLTACHPTMLAVDAGEQMAPQTNALGILLSGKAQICSADDGKNVILRTLRDGDVFGAASLFLNDAPPLSQITAQERCTVLLLDRAAVRMLMQQDAAFLDAYLAFLAGRVQFLNKRIRCFTAGSAERRLALWLAAEEHDALTLSGSLGALADTLDIGRASLYRALDKLEAQGLITRQGRTIHIVSRTKLLEIYQ